MPNTTQDTEMAIARKEEILKLIQSANELINRMRDVQKEVSKDLLKFKEFEDILFKEHTVQSEIDRAKEILDGLAKKYPDFVSSEGVKNAE